MKWKRPCSSSSAELFCVMQTALSNIYLFMTNIFPKGYMQILGKFFSQKSPPLRILSRSLRFQNWSRFLCKPSKSKVIAFQSQQGVPLNQSRKKRNRETRRLASLRLHSIFWLLPSQSENQTMCSFA